MNWTKFYGWLLKGCLAMVVLFIFSIANTTLIFAQSEGRENDTFGRPRIFFKVPDQGTPDPPDATGSRGDCPGVEPLQLPMVPVVGGNANFQLTANPYPTFWVYVPYRREDVATGKFILQEDGKESEENFWESYFQLPEKTGIVRIALPTSEKPLVPGQVYRWYFEIDCPTKSPNQESDLAYVTGAVKFLPLPDLQSQLNSASVPIEKVKIYAENSIWYDTITELAKLREEQPENTDYENDWIGLFSQPEIGLEKWANEPVVEAEIITNSLPE
ncbi:MAG: DUF928 domain-containing protein [Cyanobacteriota bacterium]|nr:DUF928 domain-containing protein [Cyanobacteriota bacterium]